MSGTDNGIMPACPLHPDLWRTDYHPDGLTKRELLAMAAMQGMLSSTQYRMPNAQNIAEASRDYADALLAELAK